MLGREALQGREALRGQVALRERGALAALRVCYWRLRIRIALAAGALGLTGLGTHLRMVEVPTSLMFRIWGSRNS